MSEHRGLSMSLNDLMNGNNEKKTEPAGLGMSLDDMIKSRTKTRPLKQRGPRSNKIQQQPYYDKHKDSYRAKHLSSHQVVKLQYSFEQLSSAEELFIAKIQGSIFIKVSSSGILHIEKNIAHNLCNLRACNDILSPLGYKIKFDGDLTNGEWFFFSLKSSSWKASLENGMSVSAFAKRDWPEIKKKLLALPTTFSDAPRDKPRLQESMSSSQLTTTSSSRATAQAPALAMMMPLMMMTFLAAQQQAQIRQATQPSAPNHPPTVASSENPNSNKDHLVGDMARPSEEHD